MTRRNPSDQAPPKRAWTRALGAASAKGSGQESGALTLRERLREVVERDRGLMDANRALLSAGFGDEESGTRMRVPNAKTQRALDPDEIASIDALLSGDFAPALPGAAGPLAAEPRASAQPSAGSLLRARAEQPCAEQPRAGTLPARAWREFDAPASPVPSPAPAYVPVGPLPPFELEPEARTTPPGPAPRDLPRDFEHERDPSTAHAEQPPASAEVFSVFAEWIAEEVGELTDVGPAPVVLTQEVAPALRTSSLAPGLLDDAEAPRTGSEPIRTHTMARLLAGHGYKERALSIYDELLVRQPTDEALLAEAEALRRSAK